MDHIFKQHNRKYVSKRLQRRIMLFLGISAVLIAFVLYDLVTGQAPAWMLLAGFFVGLGIGYLYGRLARLRWHADEETIVRHNDVLGYVLIAGYMAVSYEREVLLHDYLSGAALIAVSLAVGSGVLIGRFLGMQFIMLRMIRKRT
jgi:MFS family permease